MSSEWRTVRLGDVLSPVRRPVAIEAEHTYRMLGVRWYGNGAFAKPPVRGSSIAAKTLNEVHPGDVVYSKLFAWKGSFAVVPAQLTGVVASKEFPTYLVDEDALLPSFFALWASRPHVWTEADDLSTGTTANSRNRLEPEQFLDLEVELPPVDYQRDVVVDSVAVVDRAVDAYDRLAVAARRVHLRAREELIEGPEFEHVALSEVVASIKGGKSPRCLDRPPHDGEYGVLKVSAIRDGEFRPGEAKALPEGVEPAAPSVRAGDLLYSRANTVALVGAMCRARQDYPWLLLCDKTMRVTVDADVIDPDYLIEAVGTAPAREHIEVMAGGTSESMKNISQDAYLQTEVALPPLTEQRHIATALGALRKSAVMARQRHERLLRLRAALVEELLSGERHAADQQLAA